MTKVITAGTTFLGPPQKVVLGYPAYRRLVDAEHVAQAVKLAFACTEQACPFRIAGVLSYRLMPEAMDRAGIVLERR